MLTSLQSMQRRLKRPASRRRSKWFRQHHQSQPALLNPRSALQMPLRSGRRNGGVGAACLSVAKHDARGRLVKRGDRHNFVFSRLSTLELRLSPASGQYVPRNRSCGLGLSPSQKHSSLGSRAEFAGCAWVSSGAIRCFGSPESEADVKLISPARPLSAKNGQRASCQARARDAFQNRASLPKGARPKPSALRNRSG